LSRIQSGFVRSLKLGMISVVFASVVILYLSPFGVIVQVGQTARNAAWTAVM
jgi:hypothetical protein